MKKQREFFFTFVAALLMWGASACGGGGSDGDSDLISNSNDDVVLRWNEITLEAGRIDATDAPIGDGRIAGEQVGPTRQSRAAAIVHLAIGDAVARITGDFASYIPAERAPAGASVDAAVAQTARDVLADLGERQIEQRK